MTRTEESGRLAGYSPWWSQRVGHDWETNILKLETGSGGLASFRKSESESVSHSVVSNSLWLHGLWPTRPLLSMEFSRQEYWSGLPFPSSVSFREQVFIMGNFQNCYFSSCYKQKRIFLKSLSWQPGGFPGGKNTWMCRVLVKIGSPGVSYHQVCPLNIQQFSNITI